MSFEFAKRRGTRAWKNSTQLQLPDATIEPGPWKDAPDDYDEDDYKDVKARAPFQPGDVVWVEHWTVRGVVARKALVIRVRAEYLEAAGHYIPQYKVAFAVEKLNLERKKKLEWSEAWVRTWPGPIERGYELAKEGKVWTNGKAKRKNITDARTAVVSDALPQQAPKAVRTNA